MLTREISVVLWRDGVDEPQTVSVVLRKWSAMKLLTVLRDVEEIGGLLGDDFTLEKTMTAPQIARLIHALGEKAVYKAAGLILESVLKPKDLSVDDVLSWDLDTFLCALTSIIEMNFSEGTRKNFAGLRSAFVDRFSRSAAEADPEPRSNSVGVKTPA